MHQHIDPVPQLLDKKLRALARREDGAGSPSGLLAEFVEAAHRSLEQLASAIDQRVLDQSVAQLADAQVIHLIGLRRGYPVVSHVAYAFEKMKIPSILHEKTGKQDFYHASRPGDAVIAVTFAPYSAETVALVKEAQVRGLPVVLVTDEGGPFSKQGNGFTLSIPEVDYVAFRPCQQR